ncbi:hypothetical protein BDY17DRAFT_298676 [Neohortaea acidophila]|uniref:ATP-dependent DNA helicase n=1 Tax=Neohortaea acidophila TaxID=245834 RepID=A0A6A6PTH4_9PEZI|nr:uncharacterized protein BDY17DRAFT_298676 [Neohortaea acidophila]KAF2482527.1 hypothetical protein BDY17DRAFT_298676 [Neohortaea acidophila]
MSHSEDDFGLDDDDTAFFDVATNLEASPNDSFHSSPRPSKRRRLQSVHSPAAHDEEAGNSPSGNSDIASDDPDYYFPGELGEDEASKRNSKYKIHIPRVGGHFKDQIFTQTQTGLDDSPSRFRGAIWKRPAMPPPPPPAFNPRNGNSGNAPSFVNAASLPGWKQTTLNGFTAAASRLRSEDLLLSDAALAARLQAEENSRTALPGNAINGHASLPQNGMIDVADELADLPSDAFSSSSVENSPDKEVVIISSSRVISQAQAHGLRAPQQGLKQMTIFGQPATQDMSASQALKKRYAWPLTARNEPPTHHQLDEKAMETWTYPTNLGTIRDYQYNIVARSLFHNTLVALPTGLGKTFIAATVMLNYYRWTKDAQIVFMAPTKPLIAQQLDACYSIVGIPRRDTVLMTGETTPTLRAEEWLERRVFFMTPQTVINDLKTGIADPKKLVLIVVDEAHKATGGYAYTEVVKFVRRFNNSFRVLALTATPGSTVEAVQAVIENLGIARVELRTESSLDIREYTHEKQTETQVFDFNDEQELIMGLMAKAIRPMLEKLCSQNAYWSRDPMQLSAFGLTTARQKWQSSDAGRKAPMPIKGMVNAVFTILAQLAHSISLLKFHGIVPFYSGCLEFHKGVESAKAKGKNATQIVESADFVKMMSTIRAWRSNPDFIGHPKLEYLREVVLNHFLDAGEGVQGSDVPPSATRVMVFASYRDSTEEICRVLKRSEPMIRPHVFVGQAASKGSEGMDQKTQNAVIQDFKSGKYNTLVATSIGEEGLDIGTVDLIVCYDASSSPIRMLQRIGRTGRKRIGKVVLLLMKEKEERDYAKAQDNYAYIQKTIADPEKYNYQDDLSPRILPKHVQPVVDKRIIEIPVENSQPIDLNERGRKAKGRAKAKRPPKNFHMPDGVRTGFVKASKIDSDGDDDSAGESTSRRQRTGKRKSSATKFKPRAPSPEPEPVQLPFLGDVLLSTTQQKELERTYAHTANVEADVVIRAPNPARFPDSMKTLGETKYMRHGRATHTVVRALRAMRDINGERVERMRSLLAPELLHSAGDARVRLVEPADAVSETDDDLPANPTIVPAPKKPAKAAAKRQQQKPRAASIHSVQSSETEGPAPTRAQPAKRPRGRPKKKQPIRRTHSYGSAAGEGDESSPEPTPADMRIGTQGIDLGSRDTSGEDEEEELDSDLAEFVVRSDQPIEMASSSQQFPDDSQSSKPVAATRGGFKSAASARRGQIALEAMSESDAEADPGLAALEEGVADGTSDVEEVAAPAPRVLMNRRRKIVDDSDDEE